MWLFKEKKKLHVIILSDFSRNISEKLHSDFASETNYDGSPGTEVVIKKHAVIC